MKKQNLTFLFLVVLIILAVFLLVNKSSLEDTTGNAVAENDLIDSSFASHSESYGNIPETIMPWQKNVYIIQFREISDPGFGIESSSFSSIEEQHQRAFTDFSKIINGDLYSAQSETANDFIIGDYRYALNGMAVNMSYDQALMVRGLPYVNRMELSKMYYIDLNESIPLINADEVWNLTDENGDNVTGKNITIAVIDTGVDYTHPDLGGCFGAGCKVIGGYDFLHSDADPMDDHGHGTHVAATAAGNGTLNGVAPGASIVAYKVCNSGGSCPGAYILNAIDNATANNYSIISMSLGGSGSPDDVISMAIDNAVNNGVVAVIAAGNSGPNGGTIESPGNSRKAVTVGASYKNDNIASFSSRGPTTIGTLKPDVVAPGVYICAAEWDSAWNTSRCIDSIHVSISGTSMATPHVAGLAALILQKHKNWSPGQVKMAIRDTAKDIGQKLEVQGHGRINALEAVNMTSAPCVAEFYTYNTTYEVGGNISLKGTAQCDGFTNYSVYLSSDLVSSSGNVTQFYSEGNFSDKVSLSFSGNEFKNVSLKIPKLSNITSASIKFEGFSNGLSFPYGVRVDLSGDGDPDLISYTTLIAQEQIGGTGGYNYVVYQNKTVAQSFNWSGGELAAISVFMQRRVSGDGLIFEIRNSTDFNAPSDLITNITIPYGKVSSTLDWNVFDVDANLPSGQYWFVLKLATKGYGDYLLPYTPPGNNPYSGGFIAFSDDYGQNWSSYFSSDLSFRVHTWGYFNYSVILTNTLASEISNFLKSCPEDINGTCTVPISINSTNGTVNISDLRINYSGIYTLNPSVWSLICTGFVQANDSELCIWDASVLAQKQYALWLEVNGQNSSSSDYLFKKVKHFAFSTPENSYLVKNGINLTIKSNGQFTFKNYTLEYKSVDESNWHNIKFAINQSGNGTLGYFNSTNLPEGVYIIMLTANIQDSGFTSQANVTIRVDKKLHDGWPQELDFTVFASQKVADVDNDGNPEIVAASSRSPYIFESGGDYYNVNRSIYVFREDGSVMEGWPQPISGSGMLGRAPAIGDLDNDGDMEILYVDSARTRIMAMHHNGSLVSGWPQPSLVLDYMESAPSLYDIDNDGNLEVIFSSYFYLWVYRANGSLMWKTDTSLTWGLSMLAPLVADLDNDGYGEIFAYSNQFKKIYIFNYTGGVVEGWPYNVTPADSGIWGDVIADLDNDGDMEIIFQQRGQGIVALHHNNSAVDGWPRPVEGNYIIDLIVSDLNKDNNVEVIAFPFLYGGWNESKLFIFNSDGTNFTGFPIRLPSNTLSMRPTVGDIDGDSQMEILVSAQNITQVSPNVWYDGGVVFSFDIDIPGITPGFPMHADVGPLYAQWQRAQESAPTIADIDKDGKVNIIVGSAYYTDRNPLGAYSGGRVVIWDINASYDEKLIEWSQFGNNLHNTMAYAGNDFDGIVFSDNCPYAYNPDQNDSNGNSVGDACDRIDGNFSTINTTVTINLRINGSSNISKEFEGSLPVSFYDNSTIFVNFTFNFTKAMLNLTNVSIEKGTNGTNNYIIIHNLNITGTKTLFLKRTNPLNNTVCFIDENDVSLSELVSNCTIINCPGSVGNYSCIVSSNTFIVSGFSHSAIMELSSLVVTPPSGGTGGTGGGGGSAVGGALVSMPPTPGQVNESVQENIPVETVEATQKQITAEEKPAVEQPMEIKAAQKSYWAEILVAALLLAVLMGLIYFKTRKKDKNI